MNYFRNLTNKYFGVEAKVFITVNVICQKDDKYAVAWFKTEKGIGAFRGFKNTEGFKTLALAKKAVKKGDFVGIYRLSTRRPVRDTQVYRTVCN